MEGGREDGGREKGRRDKGRERDPRTLIVAMNNDAGRAHLSIRASLFRPTRRAGELKRVETFLVTCALTDQSRVGTGQTHIVREQDSK